MARFAAVLAAIVAAFPPAYAVAARRIVLNALNVLRFSVSRTNSDLNDFRFL